MLRELNSSTLHIHACHSILCAESVKGLYTGAGCHCNTSALPQESMSRMHQLQALSRPPTYELRRL